MILSTDFGLIHSWLATSAQMVNMPAGTVYAVIADDENMPAPFTGKKTLLTKQGVADSLLSSIGFEDAPKAYPNGVPLYAKGDTPTWTTFEIVDPCADKSSDDIMKSVAIRNLVISPSAVE